MTTETCKRWPACAMTAPHDGTRHNDPRDDLYDGPFHTLKLLPLAVRDSARKIVQDAPELIPEVIDMADHIQLLRDQVAAVSVDKDHAVREASARALDCGEHGRVIKELEARISMLNASLDRTEGARQVLLGFLHAVDEGTRNPRTDITAPQLLAALARMSRKTHAAHTRTWSARSK